MAAYRGAVDRANRHRAATTSPPCSVHGPSLRWALTHMIETTAGTRATPTSCPTHRAPPTASSTVIRRTPSPLGGHMPAPREDHGVTPSRAAEGVAARGGRLRSPAQPVPGGPVGRDDEGVPGGPADAVHGRHPYPGGQLVPPGPADREQPPPGGFLDPASTPRRRPRASRRASRGPRGARATCTAPAPGRAAGRSSTPRTSGCARGTARTRSAAVHAHGRANTIAAPRSASASGPDDSGKSPITAPPDPAPAARPGTPARPRSPAAARPRDGGAAAARGPDAWRGRPAPPGEPAGDAHERAVRVVRRSPSRVPPRLGT